MRREAFGTSDSPDKSFELVSQNRLTSGKMTAIYCFDVCRARSVTLMSIWCLLAIFLGLSLHFHFLAYSLLCSLSFDSRHCSSLAMIVNCVLKAGCQTVGICLVSFAFSSPLDLGASPGSDFGWTPMERSKRSPGHLAHLSRDWFLVFTRR